MGISENAVDKKKSSYSTGEEAWKYYLARTATDAELRYAIQNNKAGN